ncbi:transposable element Tc3 transposase [Trichonephila clavata]|uniref:Transposable element Tc3 transposase n=1 Tax=Trichonephila clavata TaxID=2740835 RepID=A0A8X6LKD9_TRICU|nr:transposable element Tc3 transposase [Trichonephila clavata]
MGKVQKHRAWVPHALSGNSKKQRTTISAGGPIILRCSTGDNIGITILKRLKRLSTSHWIHFQLISSYVDIKDNKIVDNLAKAGACDPLISSAPLTHFELFSRAKCKNKTAWTVRPQHYWYQSNRPGDSLSLDCNRQDRTTRTHFLRSLTYTGGAKSCAVCTKCTTGLATPEYILEQLSPTRSPRTTGGP